MVTCQRLVTGILLASLLSGCRSLWNKGPNTTSALIPQQTTQIADGSPRPAARELPTDETVKVCLATAAALAKKGQDREAIALYEKVRNLDPRRTDVARRLAVLYDRQDSFQKALEEYEKALQAEPKNAHLLNDVGYCYYCRGRFDDAEKSLKEAVKLDPSLKHAWTNLGLNLAQQNRIEESHAAFSKSVGPAQAWSNIGFVLMAQGKQADAKEAYRKALTIDPDLRKSRAALASLDNPTPRAKMPGAATGLAKGKRTPPGTRRASEAGATPIVRAEALREDGVEESEVTDDRRR